MKAMRSVGMITACLLTVLSASRADAAAYTVHDLGALAGAPATVSVVPRGIDSVGIVTGAAARADGSQHAFFSFWGGSLGELTAPANTQAVANAIGGNNFAGTAFDAANHRQAVVWLNGAVAQPQFVPMPNGITDSQANGINASGQAVGWALYPPQWGGYYNAYVWDKANGMWFLGWGILGGVGSWANGISDNGFVVGVAQTPNLHLHAFLWVNQAVTDLHNSQVFPGDYSEALAVNGSASVVGYGVVAGGWRHAFLSTVVLGSRHMRDLGTLNKAQSIAESINGSGKVVGWFGGDVNNRATGRAFYFDGATMHDLNDMIAPNSGWILNEATGINDSGSITGWGTFNGAVKGFLLVP